AEDNFFDLGGHSLLATQAMSRVRGAFGVELPLRALFEASTVSKLALRVEAAQRAGQEALVPKLVAVDRAASDLPLSFAQQRMWFLDQLQPGSASYNMASAVKLSGRLDVAALERTFAELVRRHEALRTTFETRDSQPVQVIAPRVASALEVIVLPGRTAAEQAAEVSRFARQETTRPFDLSRGPLFRAKLARLSETEHVLVLVMHHIVSDGWSMDVLVREVAALYGAYAAGRASPLPELEVQYADYAAWQRGWLRGDVLEGQLGWWRQQLEGAPHALELPTDRPRPATQSFRGARTGIQLPRALEEGVAALARQEGATPFMVLLAAWQVLLARYSGQQDISVGTPIAGRNRTELEGLIGFFVNTLVLRTKLEERASFRQVLRQVRETTLGAYAHQEVPFEKLVEELKPERDLSRSPLFQVMFTMQNTPGGSGEALPGGLVLSPVETEGTTAKFDLTLGMAETGRGLAASLEYNTDLYDAETAQRLLGHLGTLLGAITKNADASVWDLPLMETVERQQVLTRFAGDVAPEREGAETLHGLFAAQAEKTPAAVAVVHEGTALTYAQVEARANQLARHLRTLGVGEESRVGVCVERTEAMVVALLGVLKAGAAYVPLDATYPKERLAYMLEGTGAPVVVTQAGLEDVLPEYTGQRVRLDTDAVRLGGYETTPPAQASTPAQLAYVLYTSGSTGRPKGVAVTHASAVAFLHWATGTFKPEQLKGVLAATSLNFDLSVFEVFAPLVSGGTVVVAENALALAGLKEAGRVTLLNTVPSAVAELVRSGGIPASVETVNLAGEALPNRLVQVLYALPQVKEVNNLYGPTEDTTYSTHARVERGAKTEPRIGRPLEGTQAYVLDAKGQPTPVGVPGELYLGGEGLARGYLGQPGLTAERFVPDGFSEKAGARLYRTGDKVRWGRDGTLEYLGRMDFQVKVRGFRIELGEVEAALGAQPQVRDVVVVVREDAPGDKRLVAYVVAQPNHTADATTLRGALKGRLPEYMVPSAFVTLPALPLNANGKVDRKALPKPEAGAERTHAYVAPRTETEEVLANLWAQVLGVKQVGIEDSFFELGGHSLLATQAVSRIRTAFNVELPLRALFEAPTVEELALKVDAARSAGLALVAPRLEALPRTGREPLSFAQQRLWLLDQLQPGGASYNLPMAVRLTGTVDVEALRRTFDELVRRHESLRTTFQVHDGQPIQVVAPFQEATWSFTALDGLPESQREGTLRKQVGAEALRPFDLSQGPLFRATLVRLSATEHVLVLVMHHIVSDGWSMDVLVREVSALYGAYAEGRPSPLPELAVQYADYAAWQRGWLKGEVLEAQLGWWRQQLEGAPHALELPTDRPRPAVQRFHGANASMLLPKALSETLKTLARQEGATSFMVLLAAWQVLLARYSGQQDISVGTPIAGRNRTELEGLIGFFVNTLVLRTKLEERASFRQVLRQVKETTLGAYAHQEVPFEKLVEELRPERDLSRTPLFQVMFTMQTVSPNTGEVRPNEGLTLRSLETEGSTAKFDLTLGLAETEQGLAASLEYNTDLYDAQTARRLLGHFGTLLVGLTQDADASVWDLPLLETAERQQVLKHFAGAVAPERESTQVLHGLFAAQAAKTPAAVAVVHEGAELTYAQVEARANQLARHLRTLGVEEESRVGVCVERTEAMVVALLGVLKAGAAYVPLDATYPKERLAHMLEGTGAPVVVTQAGLEDVLPEYSGQRVRLDTDAKVLDGYVASPLSASSVPSQLAYVLYTSGSTGRPKGVAVTHASAVAFLHWATGTFKPEQLKGVLAATSLNFDLSVFEVFAPLVSGGTVVVAENALALAGLKDAGRVTLLNTVPSAVAELVRSGGIPPSVETVNLAGEALPNRLVQALYALPQVKEVNNLYGPTEDTTYSTHAKVERGAKTEPRIGRPLEGTQAYVLDAKGQPVPVGVPGELYLGGEGLARGYLGQPGLTAERFVPDGFSEKAGARLYRTGDKVRWGRDGTLEYLGRMDFQVKVRGFRIELGEVEAALGAQPSIRDAVVVVREDAPGDKRLVAYVVAQPNHTVDATTLRSALKGRLPEYMVPSAFVMLPALPLNANGKVDRKALPKPEAGAERTHVYVAPRSQTEQVLASLWESVLGVKQVGIQDNFFELGGHSLLATQAVSRIRTAFNVELPLRALFEAPTVAELALKVEAARSTGQALTVPKLESVARTGREPLSFAQQRLWLLDQLQPGGASYNLPMAVRMSGTVDVEALRRTFDELVRRHESLRTSFQVHDGQPFQVVASSQEVAWSFTALDGVPEALREKELRSRVSAEALRPFDLSQGPLFRTKLLRLTETEHVLVLVMHHIVSDGWSMDVLVREVSALYSAYAAGRVSPLPELAVQYADYAAWQRGWLKGDVLEAQLSWWRQQLAGAPHALELPTDRPRPAVQRFHGANASLLLPKALNETLKTLARQEGATSFMVLLAAWQVLLARYSGQQDISVGTPIAGRNRTELEGLIGFFVNTLVLRTKLEERASFRQVLRQVKETTLGAYAHQEVPFEKLVEELNPERDLSRTPLFQVMFTMQTVSPNTGEVRPNEGLTLRSLETEGSTAKFDLTLGLAETEQGLAASLEYNTDLYDAQTARRLLGHFGTLLVGLTQDADASVWDLPLLATEERQQVLKRFVGTVSPEVAGGTETIHGRFTEQVKRTPDAVAVEHEGTRLTYAQVDARANQLARHLRTLGVGEESRVGVCVERSVELVVAVLGVLKAGAAYVPMDGMYPKERLAYMLEATGARVVVTQASLEDVLPEVSGQRVRLDTDASLLATYPEEGLGNTGAAGQLAYVLYTSGSTGQPKGVMVRHGSVLNLHEGLKRTVYQGLPAGSRVSLNAPLVFDASVQQWVQLLDGHRLCLVPEATRKDAQALVAWQRSNAVVALDCTPSLLRLLLAEGLLEGEGAPALVVSGGEAIDAAMWAVLGAAERTRTFNVYGPTECTVDATAFAVERGTQPTVGVPLHNVRSYVLDAKGQPVPVGVPGELYLGGEGLARGYLGQPGLTAERFVPDGFSEKAGARLYRTGDKVRWGRDGTLEYLGRMDFQVKVRGFRIELGEVEAALGAQPSIRDAVVVVREDAPGDKRLVAYVVAQPGHTVDATTLRSALKGRLPEYMVPSAFVTLEALPLNANGKVDRKALPKPEAGAERTHVYVAPRTQTEQVLASLWEAVLGVKQVGTQDNFFELGGHSLLATQAVSRIRTAFNVELPLRALFEAPTVAELALKVEAALAANPGLSVPKLVASARTGAEPLSFAQQRLWLLDQLQPGSSSYNLPATVRLTGALEIGALQRTFQELVRRHEALRTTFQVRDGQPVQHIDSTRELTWEVVALDAVDAEQREADMRRRVELEARRPFDLGRDSLLRVTLLRLSEQEHVLVLVMHHIVSDGWSTGVLVREVQALYAAFSQGRPSPLPELAVQYADYAVWQRGWLKGDVLESQLSWWRTQLAGAPHALELPTDRPRGGVQTFRGAHRSAQWPKGLGEQLTSLARQEGATPFMVLLAAWQVLLARYSGQDDITVGTPIAGRNRTELEGLIGFFVNTLVIRSRLEGSPSFRQVLRQVKETTLGAYAHQEVPFEKLVEELKPERDLSRSPLFQVMFTLQNAESGTSEAPASEGALSLRSLETLGNTAKFDLTLSMMEGPTGLFASLEFNTDLFDPTTAERMLKHLGLLLDGVAKDADADVWDVPLLDAPEREQVLLRWNDTRAEFPSDGAVHERFAAQAARTPGALAVESATGVRLTYGELEARSNQLARHLRALGVGPEVRVGLCVERSPEMVVGMLAVLKAGGAYVPLDPAHPRERLAYLLDDARMPVVLTQRSLREALPEGPAHVLCLDSDWDALVAPEAGVLAPAAAGQLAYVIYTSGSTGRPKGVEVEHANLGNLVAWHQRAYGVTEADRTTQLAGLAFDASVWEIWPTLTAGASLHLPPEGVRTAPAELVHWLTERRITVAFLPTVLAEAVVAREWPGTTALRTLLTGGDRLHRVDVEGLPFQVVNHYGPTEGTVVSTAAVVRASTQAPPIGQPITNMRAYVLDARLRPVPIGVGGELYVAGAGVSRGYLRRPALTAERFIPDPFTSEPGARLYRTGDRVRWLAEGTLEFLGRADDQVKVRGFRIEPGEIEQALALHPSVRECVVAVRDDARGGKRLVAYVVGEGATAPETGVLHAFLREQLPEYMVPSAFVVLSALPLNANGKVDRRALPAPEADVSRTGPRVAPSTPTEVLLASLWAQVLGVSQVGAEDSFFELGGHSLLATQAMSRIRSAFGVELPLRALFEAPTVSRLALKVDEAVRATHDTARSTVPALVPVARTGAEPLSFAQQRLWFLDQLQPGSAQYNLPTAIRLSGRLDVPALERTFAELVRRHEALRTTFQVREGEPVQVITPIASTGTLRLIDLSARASEARQDEVRRIVETEVARPFDLSQGPLFRATLLTASEEEHVLVLVMHHAVSDGWSMRVLVREVVALYAAFAEGRESPLPELSVQYADYAAWQRGWLKGEVLEAQIAWWRQQLSGAPRTLELPTDRPRPAVQTVRGALASVRLPKSLEDAVSALARQEGATSFMVLLAAWQVLLARYSGQADISVGTPIAGRNRTELEGLIGFFVNTLVIRSRLEGSPSFRQVLRQVKETTLGAYAHQEVPFEKLVEELKPERDLSRSPLFQVMFTLQNSAKGPDEALPTSAGLSLRPVETDGATAKFDLTLAMSETGQGFAASLEYNTDLYDAQTAQRLLGHFGTLLEGLSKDAETSVWDLPLLETEERHRVLKQFAGTVASGAQQGAETIHGRFAAQALKTPDAMAVAHEGTHLTYAQVEARANQLARHLRTLGVGEESRVGVCVERSAELVVALLGVLKAGAAYVPMDGMYPKDRLAYMLEGTGARVVVTQAGLEDVLPEFTGQRVRLDSDADVLAAYASDNLGETGAADQLAYVLYTSGSTGRPKGVMVRHGSVLNLHQGLKRTVYQGLPAGSRVSLNAPLVFDASVQQLVQLLDGHCLCIVPEATRKDPEAMVAWQRRNQVVALDCTPSLLRLMLQEGLLEGEGAPALVVSGGEALDAATWEVLGASERTRTFNVYGPTECTVDATAIAVQQGRQPTVGMPLLNVRTYVLDAKGQPVPVGVPGELYLGGEGLARGYLGQPGLTAERFVPDGFSAEPGARLYRTGDKVRWGRDGTLEYLGRMDFQVKVRGFRIELGEIEAVLGAQPQVRDVVVAVREDAPGDTRLVAYVTAQSGHTADAATLRSALKGRLPEYMVPSAFVVLEALPLNANGKVDRKALPKPEAGAERSHAYAAPRTETEEVLAQLWARLLGVKQVGLQDSFFELGGHSLLATQAMSRIRSAFQVELPLRALFEAPTVEGLALAVEAARRTGQALTAPKLEAVARTGREPLSFAQQRLWLLDQLQPGSTTYNLPMVVRLSGALDVGALRRTFDELVRRHESLRTTFPAQDGQPFQVVAPSQEVAWNLTVLDGVPEAQRETELRNQVSTQVLRPFDLSQGPLFRVTLVRLSATEHVLVLAMHHIVSDGWSMDVLVREVAALYSAYEEGRASPLPELAVQYADYAAWQRGWLKGEVLEAQLSWWRQQLEGAPHALELPTDRARPAVQTFHGANASQVLPKALEEAVKALAREEGATSFMVLLAAWQVLLARYSGQADISVGTPIAGRNRTELEGLIGFFVNTLVLRTKLEDRASFRQVLRQVKETTLGAYAHQEVPFEKLVEELKPERDLSRSPLFQVMFTLRNASAGAGETLPAGLVLSPVETEGTTAKFDLTLGMTETGRGLSASLEYNTDLYDAETAQRLLGHLGVLLEGIAKDADASVWDLPLLATEERQQVLKHLAGTVAQERESTEVLHGLFAAQAAKTPAAVAVVHEGVELTYAQVEARANQLARHLRTLGVGEESRVGVCVERTEAMVVALLGVLKAGAAYVPLDATYPKERLAYMLEGTGAPVVVTQAGLEDVLPEYTGQRVRLDTDATVLNGYPVESLGNTGAPAQLAYVLYTSGSTGRPKGVAVTHASAVAFLKWATATFKAEQLKGVLAATSLNFDLSVFEVFAPLVSGGTVVVAENALALAGLKEAQRVTLLNTVPSAVAELVRSGSIPASVETVNLAGEALPNRLVQALYALPQVKEVNNLYGPTEDTTYSTHARVERGAKTEPRIGRPLEGTQAYVLDAKGQPTPVGVPGELYLGGEGLARGYLGQPGLTAERFVPDGFSEKAGARLYRTGDKVRWGRDGTLEYLGRMDFQVKVRGFRIELGEVEAALGAQPSVRDVVVVVREDAPGDKRLVAYVVAQPDHTVDATTLRSALKGRLPEYMAPSAFVTLEALPLNANGKVDRKALPKPAVGTSVSGRVIAPRDTTELQLVSIWEDLLGMQPISVDADFFELGGHSLLAVRLMTAIRKRLGKGLPLAALFLSPTVERLAALLRQDAAPSLSPLVTIQPEGSRPPLFCVHPAGGNVLGYVELSRQLGPDQPFYGLRSLGIDGEQEPLETIEAMATTYVEAVRTLRPEGPYLIAGWSMGGAVAYEMARQLRAAGQIVALLALLDPGSVSQTAGTGTEGEQIHQELAALFEKDPEGNGPEKAPEAGEPPSKDELLARLLDEAKKDGAVTPDVELKDFRILMRVFELNRKATRQYVPTPHEGSITVFRASQNVDPAPLGRDRGWNALGLGGVKLLELEGDHYSILRAPQVTRLAEELRKRITEALEEAGSK
ncbi:non-ribosomal peptide synthetase, partial [Corallococcus sp. CA047B]|uniref:non-ribosomal peptide synthase/polyketide synthase n=1 Tax=Corallococcus sp. CA047B TaxID=2316729 RepID=UPI000ECC9365